MKKSFIVLLSFLFLCCSNKQSITKEKESNQIQNTKDSIVDARLMSLYFKVKGNSSRVFLDTAMNVIDSMLFVNKDNSIKQIKYAIQKIQFYALVNRMDSAVSFIMHNNSMKWEIVGGPYYKDILRYRLFAMKAKDNNDTCLYRENIKKALCLVEKYISENEEEYASFIRKGMKGQNGRFLLTIKEYVYYSYLLYGQEEADKRLMMYKEKYQLNKDDISQLRQLYNLDIMDFVPF